MRPLSFRSDELRSLLLRSKIATLDELKQALGTSVDVTVFRKLKPLDYLTSYSHRGRYYTLREIALFDEKGLWSHATAWFSQFGTLLSTAESFVNRSPRGYFADELARAVHVDVQDALHQLAQQRRVTRQIVSGIYLYTAVDRTVQQGQLKWTPLSRPFCARNKFMFDGLNLSSGRHRHRSRPLPFRRSNRRSGRIPAEPCFPFECLQYKTSHSGRKALNPRGSGQSPRLQQSSAPY